MKVLVCHPGTQHAGQLAAMLQRQNLLGGFVTGFRVKPGSVLGKRLRLSGLRTLDASLSPSTRQVWSPELLAKAAQWAGWSGERLMRLRNGCFQKLVPKKAIAASDAVVGFDTASWILAKRTQEMGKPFILDRAAVHRSTRASIRVSFKSAGLAGQAIPSELSGIQDRVESDEIAMASRIVVASRFSERSLLDAGVAADKVAVIPYGVNWDWFAEGSNRPSAAGKLVFLFVGHVTKDKGVSVLLDAWKRLAASDAELWLAGGGDAKLIETAQATVGVRMLGKLGPDELRKAYRGASVFVFPTFCDGFGLVLLEAMSSGLPIIATANCAAPELTRDGVAGVVVPTGDAAALCAAMEDACSNRSAWSKRGAAAREIAKSNSWEAYGEKWVSLLREVVA